MRKVRDFLNYEEYISVGDWVSSLRQRFGVTIDDDCDEPVKYTFGDLDDSRSVFIAIYEPVEDREFVIINYAYEYFVVKSCYEMKTDADLFDELVSLKHARASSPRQALELIRVFQKDNDWKESLNDA